jgi:hypothetical protein
VVSNWDKLLRFCGGAFTCVAALVVAGCAGSETSPTAPSSTGPTAISEPAGPGALSVAISPNPVPWSGDVVSSCNLANRWRYEQLLTNIGSTTVTVSERVDFFDGAEVRRLSNLGIVRAPGTDTRISTEWCSSNNIEHRAHTNFRGSDDSGNHLTVTGTTARLQRK